jgi:hypothetical protein
VRRKSFLNIKSFLISRRDVMGLWQSAARSQSLAGSGDSLVSPGSRESVSGDDVCAGVGAGTATAQRFAITVEKESRSNSAADEGSQPNL